MARYLTTTAATNTSKKYKLFGTAGTYTFTTPDGVASLDVAVWGAGGPARKQCYYGENGPCYCVAGGGGGGFACGTVTTSPGTQYSVVIGDSGGSSSFGTLLSATGGSYGTGGIGCAGASVIDPVTAAGGSGSTAFYYNYVSGRDLATAGGGASGSPYGTGGNGAGGIGCCCCGGAYQPGAGGGGGWGLGHGSEVAGGGAGYSAYCSAGGGTGGPGSVIVGPGGSTMHAGGLGLSGAGAMPALVMCMCNGGTAGIAAVQVSPPVTATDNNSMDPFLRLRSLSGGGGTTSGSGLNAFCGGTNVAPYVVGMANPHGAVGGGGGCYGNGGFGGGGGYKGNGGFGGGAGSYGNPGCGGGGSVGGSAVGGQGAVLVVYNK